MKRGARRLIVKLTLCTLAGAVVTFAVAFGWALWGPIREGPVLVVPSFRFTLNTLLAAGVLLGMVEGFAFARRRARRRKGQCLRCGYDRAGVAGDALCPECGEKAV